VATDTGIDQSAYLESLSTALTHEGRRVVLTDSGVRLLGESAFPVSVPGDAVQRVTQQGRGEESRWAHGTRTTRCWTEVGRASANSPGVACSGTPRRPAGCRRRPRRLRGYRSDRHRVPPAVGRDTGHPGNRPDTWRKRRSRRSQWSVTSPHSAEPPPVRPRRPAPDPSGVHRPRQRGRSLSPVRRDVGPRGVRVNPTSSAVIASTGSATIGDRPQYRISRRWLVPECR